MLLTCGGLLLQTFQHLRNTDVGFRSERLLTFETPLFRYKDFDRRVAFINAELEDVRAIPGVINAGAISRIPFTNVADATFYWLEGQPTSQHPAAGRAHSQRQPRLLRDRRRDVCTKADSSARRIKRPKLPLAIVNEPFANRHFPGQSPLGRRFKFGATVKRATGTRSSAS